MSYLQVTLEAGGLCVFCGIQNRFPPAVLGCTLCRSNPCLCNGSRLGCPQLPLPFHAWSLCRGNLWREEGRELQHSPTSLLIGLAGLSISYGIILPCAAALVSDRHSSTLQTQIKTPTEMREEIWTLGLCCWQTSVCLVGRCYNW